MPNNFYPDIVVYEDKTVSGPQPEVKAHRFIILQNDQFLPGSSINFKAGENITIRGDVNVQGGSNVNFSIDPSLR